MNHRGIDHHKTVLHARVGTEAYEALEGFADRRGCSLTQALRELLQDLKQRELEESSASRLESLSRTLLGIVEQEARQSTRIEALVAILRNVEAGQQEREGQILQTLTGLVGLSQLIYAHMLAMVETSPRAPEIGASAQAKMRTLRGEA